MTTALRTEIIAERNVLIPLHDGVTLAGDLIRPAADQRYPVLVSYYPYHKDDVIGALHDYPSRYFAERGYASLLVDFRGLGGSEGIRWEHMDPREGEDGAEIVEWAATQPWSDGNVGMWGMSYGGASTLYAASNRPPHLRAIAAMAGDVDIYREINYPGGLLAGGGILSNWGPWMVAMGLLPPLTDDGSERAERIWRARLARGEAPHVFPLQEHPDYDAFWRTKVIPVERIDVPTFLIAGWRDLNPQAMIGTFEQITAPRRLVVGPWMHAWPDQAPNDPIDYLAEMEVWWRAWLRADPASVRDVAPVTIYVQGSGWRNEATWPLPSRTLTYFLDVSGRMGERSTDVASFITYQGDLTVGLAAGLFDPAGTGLGTPTDQGPDDLRSVTFTSDPLESDCEITGTPMAVLDLSADDADDFALVAKLCDVSPSGASALVTTGWLRAGHWESHERARKVPAGEPIRVEVPFIPTSYVFRAGQRIRLSVSCSDFPRLFPSTSRPTIQLAVGTDDSWLRLPVVSSPGIAGLELAAPDPAEDRSPLFLESHPRYEIRDDLATGTLTVVTGELTTLALPGGRGRLLMDRTSRSIASRVHPADSRVEGEAILTATTPSGREIVAEGRALVNSDHQRFEGTVTVDGQVVFEKQWTR